ncbi:hypothetical protein RB614_24075 [Phytohabitans sp. ZYX-F-186]|uniref:DUF5671 domain-containing protein n=1 Tax=Phytohabitans maris TaxID=3071409 RepID=A0ABU0ZKM9_9ACTN|nr:hypothetical protein [Phytohabitans sp. ZYX-F-186]MDQ7907603.1 hypothetical protein [Phytohabitans sp. ZYX-F-186]
MSQRPDPATSPAGQPDEPPTSGLSQLARILGAIISPTTVLTALFYYFGWMFSYWFFDYFGVNSTLLGLTTSDYLIRSVDGLFVPMTVLGCFGLVALWGHRILRARITATVRPGVARVGIPVLAGAGLALVVAGLVSVFTATVLDRYVAAAPLSLAGGVLLLKYVVSLRRILPRPAAPPAGEAGDTRPSGAAWAAAAEWAAVLVLVGASLFWAATDYSGAVGRTRACQFAQELPTYPTAVLYSERSLNLHAAGVHETRCPDTDAAYRFRYDGLKLMLQSSNQYLFLPEQWTPDDGVAILLPRAESLRLEFTPADADRSPLHIDC